MIRLSTPKKVALPGGTSFMQEMKEEKNDLLPNVILIERYKKELRREDREGMLFKGGREK